MGGLDRRRGAYQNPEGPKYGPRAFFWIARGPIVTTKTTNVHPKASVIHLLRVVRRVRKKRRQKACNASANDLKKTQDVKGHVATEGVVPTRQRCRRYQLA